MQLLVPGVLIKEYHQEVGKIMTDELIQLGLLDLTMVKNQDPEKPPTKNILCTTSHHLGLDTHDYGLVDQITKGKYGINCRTRNLYSRRGFGVRIEDDVVIQEEGPPLNLMENVPKAPDEIEQLMHQNRILGNDPISFIETYQLWKFPI